MLDYRDAVPVTVLYRGRFWCKWSTPIECKVSAAALRKFSSLDACVKAAGAASIVTQAVKSEGNINSEKEPRFLSPIGTLEVKLARSGYGDKTGLRDALTCALQKLLPKQPAHHGA